MSVDQLVQVMDEVGKDRARNRDTFFKLGSFVGNKLHKLKKPKNIAHFTTEVLVSLIPIPMVGTTIVNLENKAADKFREKWRSHKGGQAQESQDLEESVKFQVKQLDVSALDRARYKTVSQRDQYNKECARAERKDQCIRAFWLAYRYRRWQYRARKMRALAETLKSLAQDLEEWADAEADAAQQYKRSHMTNLKRLLDSDQSHPDDACGPACLYHGDSRGARNFKSFIEQRANDFDIDLEF